MKKLLKQALVETAAALAVFDIDDTFSVKIKTFKSDNLHTLALYRSRSQFKGRGPIFWVNESFVALCEQQCAEPLKQLVLTLLHEYGHVIYEFSQFRLPDLSADIDNVTDDEEDFAETFAVVVKNNAASPAYRDFIARYMAELRRT
jgi:hypothetical protein